MEETFSGVIKKLDTTNSEIIQVKEESNLTNDFLDLTVDLFRDKFNELIGFIQGDSLDQLEEQREAARKQEALTNLMSQVNDKLEKGVEQRDEMIENLDDGVSLGDIGVIGGSIALALGTFLGVIYQYTDSFRALIGTARAIGTGISKAFGAVRQALSLGALAVRIRFESINKIFMGFEKVGSRIIGIFSQFAARARAIMSVAGALGRASLMAPINAFFAAVRRVQGVFTGAGAALSKFGSTLGKTFSDAINLFRNAFSTLMAPIRAAASSTGAIGKLFQTVGGFLGKIRGAIRGVARVVSRLFAPLNFIFVGFETITGIIEGFKEGGLLGALEGGIKGFFKALVGVPLDFLKSAVAWILDLFGLDRVAEFLRSFSFSDIIESIVSAPFKVLDFIKEWVADKVKDLGSFVASLIPGPIKKLLGIDGDSEDNDGEPRGRERREGRSDIDRPELDEDIESRGRERRDRRPEIDRPELDEDIEPRGRERRGRERRDRRPEIGLPEMPGESLQSSQELAMAQQEQDALGTAGRGTGGGVGMAVADNSTTNMISQPTINNNPLPSPSRRPDTARDLYYRNPYRDDF